MVIHRDRSRRTYRSAKHEPSIEQIGTWAERCASPAPLVTRSPAVVVPTTSRTARSAGYRVGRLVLRVAPG
jgi:hypothetical protein